MATIVGPTAFPPAREFTFRVEHDLGDDATYQWFLKDMTGSITPFCFFDNATAQETNLLVNLGDPGMTLCCRVNSTLATLTVDVGQQSDYPELGIVSEEKPIEESYTYLGSVWPSGPSKLDVGVPGRYSVSLPNNSCTLTNYGWVVVDKDGNKVEGVTYADPNAQQSRIVNETLVCNKPVVDITFSKDVDEVVVMCIVNGVDGYCQDAPKVAMVITNVGPEVEPAPQPIPEPPAPEPEPEPEPEPTPEPEPVPDPPKWDGFSPDLIQVGYVPGKGIKQITVTYLPSSE